MTQPVEIKFACNSCGKVLRGKSDWVGRKFKCPHCATVQVVADPAAGAAPKIVTTPPPAKPAAPAWPNPAPVAFPRPAPTISHPFGPPASGGFPPPGPASAFPPTGPMVVNTGSAPAPPVNPYAAPTTPYAAPPSSYAAPPSRPGAAVTLRPVDLLSRTWNLFCRNLPAVLVLAGIYFTTNTLVPFGLARFARELGLYRILSTEIIYHQIAMAILLVFLGFCIQLGLLKFALQTAQHGRVQPERIVPDGFEFANGFLVAFIQGAVMMATSFACLMPLLFMGASLSFGGLDNVLVGLLIPLMMVVILLVLMIFIVLLWYPAMILVIQEKRDGISALSESPRFMNGNKLNVFLAIVLIFLLLVLPISITLGFLTRGLAMAVPFGLAMLFALGAMNAVATACTNLLYTFLSVVTYMGIRQIPVHGIDNTYSAKVSLPSFGGPEPAVGGPGPTFGGPASSFGNPPPPPQPPIGPPGGNSPSNSIGPPPGF